MAEQEKKQEAKAERPQVRKVRFAAGVFIGKEHHELDFESQWARANEASAETYPGKGLLVRHTLVKTEGGKAVAVKASTWVPDSHIRQVELAPEWKP